MVQLAATELETRMAAPGAGAGPPGTDIESGDMFAVRARLVREAVQTLRNTVGGSGCARADRYLQNVDTWAGSLKAKAPKLAAFTPALKMSSTRLTDPVHREAHAAFVRDVDMTRTNFRTVAKLQARRAITGQKLDAAVRPPGRRARRAAASRGVLRRPLLWRAWAAGHLYRLGLHARLGSRECGGLSASGPGSADARGRGVRRPFRAS